MPNPQNGKLILLASMLLMIMLGSVHAFSVFLEPLETRFQASRSSVSLTYSFALMTLTAIVLFGHRIYGLLKPVWFMSTVCLLAATGTFVAASTDQLFVVWIGYSLLFGAANGLVYPTVINQRFGEVDGIRVYGKIFTAWGFAGLFGPWLAGRLYDQHADYSTALLVAAAAGLLSAGIAFYSFKPSD